MARAPAPPTLECGLEGGLISYRNRLQLGFLAIGAILFGVGTLAYRSIDRLITDSASVAHTQEVLETLASTLALITDAESAQRGYIITGRVDYLEPYHGALPQVHASLRRLRTLVEDSEEQRKAAAELGQLVPERLAVMHRVVQARTEGFDAAQRQVVGNEGRRLTDRIRALVEEMVIRERALLNARTEAAHLAAERTLWIGGAGMALAALMFVTLLSAIGAEHAQRAAAEAQLLGTNAGLAESLERLGRVGREQATLSSMADLLQSCRTLEEAKPVIVNALRQLFPDDGVAVSLLNSSQNLMEMLLEAGPAGEGAGTETVFAPEQCWALRRGRPHLVDAQGVATGQGCPHVRKGVAPAGHACLPMMAQGETVGTLFLRPRGDAPDEAKQALVRTTSEQLGMALANLKLQETLRLQSIRDPLTGLFNRRYLEASLEREFARARRGRHPVAVLMMDVDHFKRFNDTFGHEAGDIVLAEFGAVLRSCSREDDIACRYGGEEFALILPETTAEQAVQRAEEVRERTRRLRLEHRRKSLGTVTVSIGVASYPRDGEAGDSVINAADAALYRAKQEGRDRVAISGELPPQGLMRPARGAGYTAAPMSANLRAQLDAYLDPLVGKPLGEAGAIRSADFSGGRARIALELGFPAAGHREALAAGIRQALGTDADIEIGWNIQSHAVQRNLKPLPNIRNIIAVASGKGGVGKSTVAVNLALALRAEGAKVGILDADIYGPSQPQMLGSKDRPTSPDGKAMNPIVAHGLQAMSIGFLIDEEQPMVWRGPMVTQALSQMLAETRWSDLDYLVVDLPPGTGDIQLSLSQKIPVSGAVIVTTPQDIALLDAKKGLQMFRKVEVSVLGVVENMSTHVCGKCGHEEPIFGTGGGRRLAQQYAVELLGQLPLDIRIREQADGGNPTVAADAGSELALRYRDIARKAAARLAYGAPAGTFPTITITDE